MRLIALLVTFVLMSGLLGFGPRPNLPPIANDDDVTVWYEPSYVDIPVLENDTDPEGRPLTVVGVSSLEGSRAVILKGQIVRVYLSPSVTPPDAIDPIYLLAQGSYLVSDGVNASKAEWYVFERPQAGQ